MYWMKLKLTNMYNVCWIIMKYICIVIILYLLINYNCCYFIKSTFLICKYQIDTLWWFCFIFVKARYLYIWYLYTWYLYTWYLYVWYLYVWYLYIWYLYVELYWHHKYEDGNSTSKSYSKFVSVMNFDTCRDFCSKMY